MGVEVDAVAVELAGGVSVTAVVGAIVGVCVVFAVDAEVGDWGSVSFGIGVCWEDGVVVLGVVGCGAGESVGIGVAVGVGVVDWDGEEEGVGCGVRDGDGEFGAKAADIVCGVDIELNA